MNKTELIKKVAKESKVSESEASKILDAFVGEVKTSLSEGNKVTLPNFGSFVLSKRAPKTFVNPRNGKTFNLPERTLPYFKASAKLKAKLQD